MPLLGKGVAAIWHNVDAQFQDDYNHWHCFEHVPERVGIDGFLRGKRYVAIDGNPEFFHFYETKDVGTLSSNAYLDRLNNPTTWTRRIGPNIKDNNRTLSKVISSQGRGSGAAILTARLSADETRECNFFDWFSNTISPHLIKTPGIIAAHLLKADKLASQTETEEKAMRDRPDEIADWIIFVEGIEESPLKNLWTTDVLSEDSLLKNGAKTAAIGTYRLHFCLSAQDLL
ncbi:MAG: hypothetical protein CMM58_14810 [Rhodospirillaceae bacterium]|nr:hypothetical protein [Rhodospirillaceae bacterium]|tara:strand:- start:524 stop:1213 length:690 start_codon:yes stop_codon:yes gene_type:complete